MGERERRRGRVTRALTALLAAAALVATGCDLNAPSTRPSAPASEATTSPVPSSPPQAPDHPIGIRGSGPAAEFFDRRTGKKFTVRGANYLHLEVGPAGTVVDRTFAPSFYDGAAVEADLQAMRDLGYTVVRSALDICQADCIGAPGGGLRGAYLANIADFLQRAKRIGLQVIFQSNDLPEGAFMSRLQEGCCSEFDGYMNSQYFSQAGVATYRDYWTQVVTGLRAAGAPLDAILAYVLRGEVWYFSDKPPVSLRSGSIRTAIGRPYDMAKAADRSQLVTDGIRFWISEMRAAVHSVDPGALVGVGAFAPNAPNAWRPANDTRTVPSLAVFAGAPIDFFDIHPYPGYISLPALMKNFGITGRESFPVVIGEYGAFKFAFRSPAAGARALMDWQVASCPFGIDGWFHWQFRGTNDKEVWTGTEANGAINLVLSPAQRPDPCRPKSFAFFEDNLARGATVRASSSTAADRPTNAVDANRDTAWLSGDGPPGWIELRLRKLSTLKTVRLTVAQDPAGATTHVVLVGSSIANLHAVHTFKGQTRDGQVLAWTPSAPLRGVLIVRILTTRSPSWVAWREIGLIGSQ
jgi:hypothetical protein